MHNLITECNFDSRYKSDHMPITLAIRLLQDCRGKGTWKFNNDLLLDEDYANMVRESLEQYTKLDWRNAEPNSRNFIIDDQVLWETIC